MYLHLLIAIIVLVVGGMQTFTTKHKVWIHFKTDGGNVIVITYYYVVFVLRCTVLIL